MTLAAVILAAGEGSRFGRPGEKLRALFREAPLFTHAVTPAAEAGLDELVVVTGAVDLSDLVPAGATLLANEQWALGQASSLRVAIDWCQRRRHEAVVVGLGDMPGLTAAAWRAVARHPDGPIVVATYGGRRGHPVRLDAEVWPSLPIDGEAGARLLMSRHPELVVEVACEGSPGDVDTREDLKRWS